MRKQSSILTIVTATSGMALAMGLMVFSASRVAAQAEADPLAELAQLGDTMSQGTPEAGGSIRAKRDADPEALKRMNDTRNFEARVQEVSRGRFPLAAVKLQVLKPAKDGPGKDLAKNSTLVVVPRMKVEGASISTTDVDTVTNAGAFYLQEGDKVIVRVGAQKGKIWEAEVIERK